MGNPNISEAFFLDTGKAGLSQAYSHAEGGLLSAHQKPHAVVSMSAMSANVLGGVTKRSL